MALSTIKSSGGDFTSLSAWEAATQADLTGNGPEEAQCFDFADTTGFSIVGWTTTAADFIRIFTAQAERHNGTARNVSGSGYELSSTGTPINIREDFVRIEGLVITSTATGAVDIIAFGGPFTAASNDIRIDQCIIHDQSTALTSNFSIQATVANLIFTIQNSIVYGKQRGITMLSLATGVINYCTFFTDADTFGIFGVDTMTVKDTYVGGYSTEDFWTGGNAPSGNNNVSADTSAETDYTASHNSKAAGDQFVNASVGTSADFHLKAGSFLETEGAPVSGITVDIDGDTRDVSTPDVGADEFVAVAAGNPWYAYAQQ